MIITKKQEKSFKEAVTCHICNKALGTDRVRDHDHITGLYRGPAHNACNLSYNHQKTKLTVIFHNLKGYDSHFIFQHAGELGVEISAIPQTIEKYLGFEINKVLFIDSLNFMAESLEKLVDAVKKAGKKFKYFNDGFSHLPEQAIKLLLQKGVFPYEWYDSDEKLQETQLPKINEFYSSLTGESIKSKEYLRANLVWMLTNCETFSDYLNLYLKTDVLLLADVFEEFRAMSMDYYKLDPCHYYTAPALSWDAMLKRLAHKLNALMNHN
jgi:hypothetical protein